MRLYSFWRSSAAYRVRIALALKGLDYVYLPVNLTTGEQRGDAFQVLNPQGLVPILETDGLLLTQSLAILEYLEEVHPSPALLPPDAAGRARVRVLALGIACEIHPLNTPRLLNHLRSELGASEDQSTHWYQRWCALGFAALEARLAVEAQTGTFCHGEAPGLADVFLVPQIANARRFQVDMTPYPTVCRIEAACRALPAFDRAAPERQPDAPAGN